MQRYPKMMQKCRLVALKTTTCAQSLIRCLRLRTLSESMPVADATSPGWTHDIGNAIAIILSPACLVSCQALEVGDEKQTNENCCKLNLGNRIYARLHVEQPQDALQMITGAKLRGSLT